MADKLDLHALVKSTGVNPATLECRDRNSPAHARALGRVDGFDQSATNSAVCPFICCKTHPGSLPAVQHTKGDNRS